MSTKINNQPAICNRLILCFGFRLIRVTNGILLEIFWGTFPMYKSTSKTSYKAEYQCVVFCSELIYLKLKMVKTAWLGEKPVFYTQGLLPLHQWKKQSSVLLPVNYRSRNEFRSAKSWQQNKTIFNESVFVWRTGP